MAPVKNITTLILSLILLILFVNGCSSDESAQLPEGVAETGESLEGSGGETDDGCKELTTNKVIRVAHGLVELRPPAGKFRGDLLVLPPWDQPRDVWCHRSNFCRRASEKGYRLIMPEMGKSIYINAPYAETREDWRSARTYLWLRDSLIPHLQERYCMLDERSANFVVGLSSGSRGVVKLLADMPGFFTAGAAFSGDYDPSQMIGDNIYNGFLGTYEEFPERWESSDNLIELAAAIKAPLYLGHGTEDPMIPFTQTRSLYDAITAAQPDLNVKLNLAPGQGEGFAYWNVEIERMLSFFEDTQANRPETP